MRGNHRGHRARSITAEDGFINVAVSKATRDGLNNLKAVMRVRSQAEVIEKLVAIGVAIEQATR
jgi:hypothetical protein